jgi:superfamily II DNA/RNA helicase
LCWFWRAGESALAGVTGCWVGAAFSLRLKMPKRTKEEKAAAKAEREAKRQRRLSAAAAAPAVDAAAAAPAELLETVSLSELQRLREQPSVANADSDEEDQAAEQQADAVSKAEQAAIAARVALRQQKGEKLLKTGQHAKALKSFEAALELQPDSAELRLLVKTAKRAASKKRKQERQTTSGAEVATAEHAEATSRPREQTGEAQEKPAKKKSKKKKKKNPTALAQPGPEASSPDFGAIEELRAQRGIVLSGPSADGQPGPWCAVAPIGSFADAPGLSAELISRLSRHAAPTAVQSQCVPLALARHDVVAVAPTGSGKTLAFLVPLLAHALARRTTTASQSAASSSSAEQIKQDKKNAKKQKKKKQKQAEAGAAEPKDAALANAPEGSWVCADCGNLNYPLRDTCNTRTCKATRPAGGSSSAASAEREKSEPARPFALVLAPARELAQQIYDEAKRVVGSLEGAEDDAERAPPLRVVCLYGGVPKGDQAKRLTSGIEGSREAGPAEVVIGTPGRCLDFIQEDKYLGTPLVLDQVQFLVLDEADRMLNAGFLSSILQIAGRCAPRSLSNERANALRAALRRYRAEDPSIGVARALKRIVQLEHSEQGGSSPAAGWAHGMTGSDVAYALDTIDESAAGDVVIRDAGAVTRQTMFVTATWAVSVQAAAAKVMGDHAVELHIEQSHSPQALDDGADVTNNSGDQRTEEEEDAAHGGGSSSSSLQANRDVRQRVSVVGLHKEKLPLLRAELAGLRQREPSACVMIFCKTKKRCDWLAGKLLATAAKEGGGGGGAGGGSAPSWVKALHSGKSQPEREQVLSEFRSLASSDGGGGGVLVATNVASRGLDIPAMSLVIVYDFTSVESYVHQIGRSGRGEGRAGEALTMYVEGDGEAAGLAGLLERARQPVPTALAALAASE